MIKLCREYKQASMAKLTEEMVIARSKQSDLSAVTKLNCWGAELTDVTLLRRMPNVEVLAFSINKIRHLEDFAWCGRLRELYVRKNDIRSLHELRHLRRLPALHALWLDENPCTDHPRYRMTVLRNLPNLEKLDNVPVQPEEVAEAMRHGEYIPDSDDEGYPQQADSPPRAASPVSPPRPSDLLSESPEPDAPAPEPVVTRLQSSPPRPRPASAAPRGPTDMTSSYTEARIHEEAPLRHSVSTHSVKDYSISCLGDGRPSTSPLHEGRDRQDPRCPLDYDSPQSQYNASEHSHSHARTQPREQTREWRDSSRDLRESSRDLRESSRDLREEREFEKERDYEREYPREGYTRDFREREREREREYPSAVMGARRGFSRRPVTRNSNLLSALLCLVKELDYPSLEVAEMAVRCRMDELANGQ